MKKLIFLLIGLNLLSCQSIKSGLTQKAFESKVEATEKANINDGKLADGWYATLSIENEFKRLHKKTSDPYFIHPRPVILPDNFSKGNEFENNQGLKGLAIYFDRPGIKSWAKATSDNTGSHLVFILDNEILTAPLVHSKITNGASAFWKDDLTENQWEKIKAMIRK